MNPLLKAFLFTLVRAGLLWLSGWMVNKQIFSKSELETYISAAAVFLVTFGWSLADRYISRVKFLTALSAPAGATEAEIKEMIKNKVVPVIPNVDSTTPPTDNK